MEESTVPMVESVIESCGVTIPHERVRLFVMNDDFKTFELLITAKAGDMLGKAIVKQFNEDKTKTYLKVVSNTDPNDVSIYGGEFASLYYDFGLRPGQGAVERLSIVLKEELS